MGCLHQQITPKIGMGMLCQEGVTLIEVIKYPVTCLATMAYVLCSVHSTCYHFSAGSILQPVT